MGCIADHWLDPGGGGAFSSVASLAEDQGARDTDYDKGLSASGPWQNLGRVRRWDWRAGGEKKRPSPFNFQS